MSGVLKWFPYVNGRRWFGQTRRRVSCLLQSRGTAYRVGVFNLVFGFTSQHDRRERGTGRDERKQSHAGERN